MQKVVSLYCRPTLILHIGSDFIPCLYSVLSEKSLLYVARADEVGISLHSRQSSSPETLFESPPSVASLRAKIQKLLYTEHWRVLQSYSWQKSQSHVPVARCITGAWAKHFLYPACHRASSLTAQTALTALLGGSIEELISRPCCRSRQAKYTWKTTTRNVCQKQHNSKKTDA